MYQTSGTEWLLQLLDHRNFLPAAGMVVGIIAIIAGATVIIVVSKLCLSHRQRMAMIARGMHPDAVFTELVDEPQDAPSVAAVPMQPPRVS